MFKLTSEVKFNNTCTIKNIEKVEIIYW